MKRIEKVEQFVQKAKESVTASEVADALQILRCDASSDLNKLCQQDILEKSNTRPVRFFLSSDKNSFSEISRNTASQTNAVQKTEIASGETDLLSSLSRYNPSLRHALHLAKAAVSYPPHGLNILITGETGVGKNFLAETIWQYAVDKKLFEKGESIPFVSFSCAEYADNPQLLLSQLFGYVKGAFSGANETRSGLLEKANGGIFFLDEIHRLPSTGQEILFTLIDKGVIRRLGDTVDRPIQVMLLCATTEDTNTALLKTFLRRIPVSVHIPNLNERTVNEKFYFIHSFLQQESRRIQRSIYVSRKVLKSLLAYEPKGNIGELKNIINLCCAKAYLSCLSNLQSPDDAASLTIDLIDLPPKVYSQNHPLALSEEQSQQPFLNEELHISPDSPYPDILPDHSEHNKDILNLYGFIEKRINAYRNLQMNYAEIESRTAHDLDTYYRNIARRLTSDVPSENAIIDEIIPVPCKNAALNILNSAEKHFNCTYSEGLTLAFALHLQQL